MDRFKRTALLGVILSTLILSDKPALGSLCSYRSVSDYCVLENLSFQKNSDIKNIDFPNEKLILLDAPNILFSCKNLFTRLPTTVEKLLINDGSVPEVYIPNTLKELKVLRSQLRNVIIDELGIYLLKYLSLPYNNLLSIPENITQLTNLEKLYLHDNDIEIINMDHFKSLTRLEVLALHRNRITRIDTKEELALPNLSNLSLNSNYLENLSIKFWIFSNLKIIYLKNNRLQLIENFPEQFPTLNETALYHNHWSCRWLERTNLLWTGKIKVFKGSELCPEKSVKRLCCYGSLSDVQNYLETSMTSQFEQISAKLDRVIEIMDGKISQLDNKLRNDLNSDMARTVQSIREETKSVESTARRQMLDEFKKINDRVHSNKALVESDRAQLEKKVGELKSALIRSGEQCRNSHNQIKEEFKLVNRKLNENRALIDDIVEDLYLEELEKQEE